jgi:hypothetical protein
MAVNLHFDILIMNLCFESHMCIKTVTKPIVMFHPTLNIAMGVIVLP